MGVVTPTWPSLAYVTSQYAHAVEQPVPIVRLKIPAANVEVRPRSLGAEALDTDRTLLDLKIYPPPRIRAEPIIWPVDLLRFEYLMRRARGGTPNVLATESELAVRDLKDELLARFASTESEDNLITFFAADRNRYTPQTIMVAEEGQ